MASFTINGQYPVQHRPPAQQTTTVTLASRTYHLKSRAGCFTCKRRHVRCDEVKPTCSACQRLLLGCAYPATSTAKKLVPTQAQAQMQGVLFAASPSSAVAGKTKGGQKAGGGKSRAAMVNGNSRAAAAAPRMTLHLWTPEDSARAIVHSAFAEQDPVGVSRSDFFSTILAQESVHKDCYRYVCLVIRDLSFSSQADYVVRIAGFMPLSDPGRWRQAVEKATPGRRSSSAGSLGSDTVPGGSQGQDHDGQLDGPSSSVPLVTTSPSTTHVCAGDGRPGIAPRPAAAQKHVLNAVGNYARALASFRASLPTMSPRDILYATMCFAMLELMQGNFASRNVIISAGIALLRPHIAAPRGLREDGAVRYGLHTRYGDSRSLCNSEGFCIRVGAANVLSGVAAPPAVIGKAVGKTMGEETRLVPEFRLPVDLPVAEEGDGFDVLRRKWEAFHGTLECWLLSVYWAVAVGQKLDAVQHLADQRRMLQFVSFWRVGLDKCFAVRQEQFMTNTTTNNTNNLSHESAVLDEELSTLSILSVYLHCMQMSMSTVHDVPSPSHAPYPSIPAIFQPLPTHHLVEIARQTSREINNFRIFNFTDLFFDATMLPMISRQAVLASSSTATTAAAGDKTSSDVTGDLAERERTLTDMHLSKLHIFTDVLRKTFEAQEEELRTGRPSSPPPPAHDFTTTTAGRGSAVYRPFHSSSSSSSSSYAASAYSSSSSTSDSLYSSSSSLSSSSAPLNPTTHPGSSHNEHHDSTTTTTTKPNPQPRQQHPRQHSQPPSRKRKIPTTDFPFMPLSARKELTLLCVPMQIALAMAALRDGVFPATVVG